MNWSSRVGTITLAVSSSAAFLPIMIFITYSSLQSHAQPHAFLEGRRLQASYKVGGEASNSCPAGFESLMSESECKNVATDFCVKGYKYYVDQSDHPRGCLVWGHPHTKDCEVYFNVAKKIAGISTYLWKLCKSQQGSTLCVPHYPNCLSGSHCVIPSCKNGGCTWKRAPNPTTLPSSGGYNYIDGYDGYGAHCTGDYQAVPAYHVQTAGTCVAPLTELECKAVATAINAPGKNTNPPICHGSGCAPVGCYQEFSFTRHHQKVYYNTDRTGVCTPERKCFCKVVWKVTHGSCKIDGDCVTTPNYPNNYGGGERCVMTTSASHISATSFETESSYDKLHVNGHAYHGKTGPSHVAVGGSITWTSDTSQERQGWRICGESKVTTPNYNVVFTERCCCEDRIDLGRPNSVQACANLAYNHPDCSAYFEFDAISPSFCGCARIGTRCQKSGYRRTGTIYELQVRTTTTPHAPLLVPCATMSPDNQHLQFACPDTTTPQTTTHRETCASFACDPPYVLHNADWSAIPGGTICNGPCTKAQCCKIGTTTPTFHDPWGIPMRKDDTEQEALMQQANKKTKNSQAWSTIALLATGGFAVVSAIHVYRRLHNTRRVAGTSAEDGMMPSETENLVQ